MSIPDQRRQIEGYCLSRGWEVAAEFVEAGHRGAKIKKKLEIDPLHADTVRLIYRLALNGVDDNGPMGLKVIVTWLNDNNIRTRQALRRSSWSNTLPKSMLCLRSKRLDCFALPLLPKVPSQSCPQSRNASSKGVMIGM